MTYSFDFVEYLTDNGFNITERKKDYIILHWKNDYLVMYWIKGNEFTHQLNLKPQEATKERADLIIKIIKTAAELQNA